MRCTLGMDLKSRLRDHKFIEPTELCALLRDVQTEYHRDNAVLLDIIRKRNEARTHAPTQTDKYTLSSNLYPISSSFLNAAWNFVDVFPPGKLDAPRDWGVGYGEDVIVVVAMELMKSCGIKLSYFQLMYAIRTSNVRIGLAKPVGKEEDSYEHARIFVSVPVLMPDGDKWGTKTYSVDTRDVLLNNALTVSCGEDALKSLKKRIPRFCYVSEEGELVKSCDDMGDVKDVLYTKNELGGILS